MSFKESMVNHGGTKPETSTPRPPVTPGGRPADKNEPAMTPNDFANVVYRIMNEALEADPSAISRMVGTWQWCHRKLAEHPHIIVRDNPHDEPGFPYMVGPLGVLNGILSAAGCSVRLGATYNTEDVNREKVLHFDLVDSKDAIDWTSPPLAESPTDTGTTTFVMTYPQLDALLGLPQGYEVDQVEPDDAYEQIQITVKGDGLEPGMYPKVKQAGWTFNGWGE